MTLQNSKCQSGLIPLSPLTIQWWRRLPLAINKIKLWILIRTYNFLQIILILVFIIFDPYNLGNGYKN